MDEMTVRMTTSLSAILEKAREGHRLSEDEAGALAACNSAAPLMDAAAAIRDRAYGDLVTYSRKVFIPLTQLCRDSCHYCTFAHPPRPGETAYLSRDQVLAIAAAGARAGCTLPSPSGSRRIRRRASRRP